VGQSLAAWAGSASAIIGATSNRFWLLEKIPGGGVAIAH
jgi:hypothetical protein